ncbi:MAG: acyl-CoA thioesterase-1 [Cyclobacteriaceae bacterium]|jgi:acyl-CoA thioesterase-1
MSNVSFSALIIILFLISCGGEKKATDQKSENSSPEVKVSAPMKKAVLMFFGNSITAGYQLDPDDAFPALISDKMDTLDYDYLVINAGLSGETSAGGLSRIDWVLSTVPDVFVLELGANDGLRGLDLAESKINLQGIIDKVKLANKDVKIIIAGMEMPPNLGKTYTNSFRQIFRELATENNATLIPFILDGVGGNPELNLPDGIHPTAEGHMIIAKNIWEYVESALVLNRKL